MWPDAHAFFSVGYKRLIFDNLVSKNELARNLLAKMAETRCSRFGRKIASRLKPWYAGDVQRNVNSS